MSRTRRTRPRPNRRRGALGGVFMWVSLVLGLTLVVASSAVAIRGLSGLPVLPGSPLGKGTEQSARTSTRTATRDLPAPALDGTDFDPEWIISDEVFHDTSTMDEATIADFIALVGKGCQDSSKGVACLSRYRVDTAGFAADQYCPGGFEGAAGDSAAAIIHKSAQGCGINPQVLLTFLQKEQGLLTASGSKLTARRYEAAMGYGCPDDAPCDARYQGLAAQVWYAARQFRMYEAHPEDYWLRVQVPTPVKYAHAESCGARELTVVNQATVNLYLYTPYQPDEAALNGGSTSCSSWGNLNVHSIFRAWFGPPR
ncbi:hypothetical protein I6B53_00605 [Schaalia sp. 19OD2882]|uniref:hypothetical protein n=1 Tax=Schaalia sp. 19OD2882 TaxID=2794089 RepID=UPI001C1EE727|nr:hypothetical protein [Schaalia sp. 19OD2882]QWW19679.1 hypothetical protein I6B53_00605 [Schaalia sp. 19OD2882]